MARDGDQERKYYQRLARAAEWLSGIEDGKGMDGLKTGCCTEVRIKMGASASGECLLVIKAYDETGKHIAFVGALDVIDALLTWRAKADHGGLKWREDVPWEERG